MSAYVIILGIVILIAIVAPFLSKKTKQESSRLHLSQWEQEREQIFSQLSDLEYDYRMAKISEHDYQQAKVDLSAKAAAYTSRPQEAPRDVEQEADREIETYLQKQNRFVSGQRRAGHEH